MKVKTHRLKEITWILSLSPRECLGFRLLQFISLKISGEEKEPHLNLSSSQPLPLIRAQHTENTQLSSGPIEFHEESSKRRLPCLILQNHSSIKIASVSNTLFSLILILHPALTHQGDLMLCVPCIFLHVSKEPLSYGPANKERNLKYFKSNKSHKQLFGTRYRPALDNRAYCGNWLRRKEL